MNALPGAEVAPLSARTALPSGLVTFLFTDIEGSTRLAQMLGAGYRRVLDEHRRVLRRALTGHGTELFTEGDSFFVAFADAGAALASCLAGQRALAEHEWPNADAIPRVRMGLHTGLAEPVNGEYASPEVHRASRVASAAHGGQVLCSAATVRHIGALPPETSLVNLGRYRLRGFDAAERLYQLVAPGLERHFPRLRTAGAVSNNLPVQVTSFVGRDTECVELAALLSQHRLVTVVGAGGAGKTRLAVRVADTRCAQYPDGVWFIDLAEVARPERVAGAIAAVLGLRPEPGRPLLDTVVEYAAGQRLLLVLDTCDAHLGAAGGTVIRLLAGGSGARILTTSREPLGVPGEVVWRIPALSLAPAPGGGPSEAAELLAERTVAARGGHSVPPGEVSSMSRVAARLDGLPLAIELAAARLRVLSAVQLAERLDDVLGTLDAGRADINVTDRWALGGEPGWVAEGPDWVAEGPDWAAGGRGPVPDEDLVAPVEAAVGTVDAVSPGARRHRTMHATVAWSYRTLRPRAARLLRWLAVFAGPVDLPTVEWLVGYDALDPLAVLVDKSLIQAEPGVEGTSYRMLDSIRAYAARRLAEVGEERVARDRHVAWALHALRRARLGTDGRSTTLSLYALDPLADEVRAALRWTATNGSARDGLRLAAGLDPWWGERGLSREGRLWLFRLYGRIAESRELMPASELAVAYHMHATHAGADGEIAEELRFSRRAEAAARQAGEPGLLARVLAGRGATLMDMGDLEQAETACREVIDWAAAERVSGDALFAVYRLAALLWRRGALDEAAELLGAARPVEASQPGVRGQRGVDMLLGMVALARGDLVAAHDHLVVALRSRMSHGFHSGACETISGIAVRCVLGGDPVTAARLFGAAQATRSAMRVNPRIYGPFWVAQQAKVRAEIGDVAFDEEYALGAVLSLSEAAVAALAVEHPDLAANSVRFADGPVPHPADQACPGGR